VKNSLTLLAVSLTTAALCANFLLAQQQSPTLKKDLTDLQFFQGTWSCKGTFPSTGKSIESRVTFTPDLDGAWLSVRHDDIPPNLFHALELWGWDAKKSQFTATIFDSFGGARHFTSQGWQDQSFTWNGDSLAGSTAPSERFAFRKDSATQFTVNWEVNRDGSWKVGDTLSCTH
jgi:hypothetical protein